jgi:AcrR family transcriptional regulator
MPSSTSIGEPASSTLSARDAQRLETRARLFDAAVTEIGRSGLAGADVSTIAAAAGVARGTFYFHFPTKEHVVVEVERAEEAKIVARLGTRCFSRTP